QGTLQLTDKDLIKIITLLINFFVRRNLTDVPPTRDLIRLFISFVEEIEANGYKGEQIYTNLRTLLISKLSADEELSFDRKFEQSLSGSVYEQNRDATRFILCALAEKGMTKETFQDLWAKNEKDQYIWTIEHIFPQGSNIPDCWVKMIADGDKDKAKDYQSEYVHTLGNLTITGYNSTLGNKSFEYKRDRQDSQKRYIGYKNGLNLNKDVCNQETWNTDIIKERTKRLVEEITNLFKI
ncbi:MAG: HNH endonuclease, partial [Alphaproteobacteria bacterium]|nr:HNH endonuclease [Alphaproteobacteria bacterium]